MKTQLGAEIGRATSLFKTPAIVSHDLPAGSITFERICGFTNLKQALSTWRRRIASWKGFARTLAAIHNRLKFPEGYVISLSDLGPSVLPLVQNVICVCRKPRHPHSMN